MEKKEGVQDIADKVLKANKTQRQGRQFMLWILALVVGAALGWLGIKPLNELFTFIATVFTRLFQFIAVPTIALAVITTLAALGGNKNTGRIFCSCCYLYAPHYILCSRHRTCHVPLDCTGKSSC